MATNGIAANKSGAHANDDLAVQVLLFMAGFSIGSVLEKQRLSNIIASVLLTPFGNKPENVLLGIMSLGCFLSMWIRCCSALSTCARPRVHALVCANPGRL